MELREENAVLRKALTELLNYAINTARSEGGRDCEDEIESIKTAKSLIGPACSCLPAMGSLPALICRNCYEEILAAKAIYGQGTLE